MKFRLVLQVPCDVEATDIDAAKALAMSNRPHLDVCGWGVKEGKYSIQSIKDEVLILSIKEKR